MPLHSMHPRQTHIDGHEGPEEPEGTRAGPDLRGILRDARYLVAVGRLERVRWYRSLWAFQLMGFT